MISSPGILFYLPVFAVLAFCALILSTQAALPKKETIERHRLHLLCVLPAVWVAELIWDKLWLLKERQSNMHSHPQWALYPLDAALPLLLVLSAYCVWSLRGMRRFATLAALVNGCIALLITVSVEGDIIMDFSGSK
jgi:hypothetical protein